MSKGRAIATIGVVAILAVGVIYYLSAVRCLGHESREPPKPYDVAMYEVYSTVLRGVGGKALLIQSDTRGLVGLEPEPSNVPERPANDAASQAFADYRQRHSSPLAIAPRFQLNKKYGFVSSDRITALLQTAASGRDPTFCKDFSAYDTFVALSPVGFDSDQSFAVVMIHVWRGPCFGAWSSESKTLRKHCGRWKIIDTGFSTILNDRF